MWKLGPITIECVSSREFSDREEDIIWKYELYMTGLDLICCITLPYRVGGRMTLLYTMVKWICVTTLKETQ